jgi:hypothetical protein
MEIEARDPAKLAAATDAAAAAVRAKLGDGRVTGRLQAVVTTVKRG